MNQLYNRASKKHFRFLIVFLTLTAIVNFIAFNFLRKVEFDTQSFVAAARYLFNLEGAYNFQSRLSKPLVLILPGLIEWLTGIHPKFTFLIQNIACYYALIFIIYKTVFFITKSGQLSLYSVIAYYFCQPFAVFSLFYMVDVVGWFFSFLIIYLTLKKLQTTILIKDIVLISIIAGFGMLAKESTIAGFIFLGFFLLFKKYAWQKKIKHFIIAILAFFIPILIAHYITNYFYNVSIFNRVVNQRIDSGFVYYNLSNSKQLFRILDAYWFLAAIGIVQFIKTRKLFNNKKALFALLAMAIICVITMPIYPFIVDRILFMIAPALIIFIAMGAYQFKKLGFFVLLFGGLINILVTYIIYKYNFSGILRNGLILYGLILFVTYLYSIKTTTNPNFD